MTVKDRIMSTDAMPATEAEHLTWVLRQNHDFRSVHVRAVTVAKETVKQRSRTLRLYLDHDGAGGTTPASVILKTGHLDGSGRPAYANRREVTFYRDVAPTLPPDVVPRCFEAVHATDTASWYLLLEDLTDSHALASEHPLPPAIAQCEAVVRAWARLHAAHWGDKNLSASWRALAEPTRIVAPVEAADQVGRFVDTYPDVLSPERVRLFERLVDKLPDLLGDGAGRCLTLVHGDAHWWNCFVPRPGVRDGVRLFDWEGWGLDSAAMDLAYMLAMLWFPDRRRRTEQPLLDLYHAELLAGGVVRYDRRVLEDDYRLSVLLLLLRPIGQAAYGIPARVWWPNLERIVLAVDDLGCRDLLA